MKTIGEITKVGAGQSAPQDTSAFSNDGTPFVRAGSLEFLCKGVSLNKLERINEQQAKIHKLKIYPSGTILFAKSGMSAVQNRVFVLPEPAHVVSHLATVEVKNGVDSKFLSYFWQNFKTSNLIQDPAYPSISLEAVGNVEIELPSHDEQKRIAAILDKADRLRRQRRFAQTLSDSFLQSVFIKMFGEHLSKDFSTTELIDLVTITGGGTPSRDVPEYFTGKIAWLTSKDMRGDYIFDTEEHITEKAIKDSATKLVSKGSILMVVKSKVLMNRLPLAIAEIPLCHGQDIKSIQCSNKVNSLFLLYVLKYNERNLLQLARGANTEGLTLPMIESVPVPNVPLPLQEKFAEIVQKFERVRRQQREATRQAEHLFQTLLHRAFRGEL